MKRYEVEKVVLDSIHPLWPDQTVYKIFDIKLKQTSFSCYTRKNIANKIVERKNEN